MTRHATMVTTLAAVVMTVAACGAGNGNDASTVAAGNAPSEAQVRAGLAAGQVNTGGSAAATISGAKSGSAEMTDVSFCVRHVSAGGMSMNIFAMAGNNGAWAINLTNGTGMLSIGEHAISPSDPSGVSASLVDKSTGSQPSEWQQYKASGGSIAVTASDTMHIAGSYDFSANPTYPRSTGDPVTIKGTFDAPRASGCKLPAAGAE